MKKIILIGGGGHCHSCIDVILSTKEYEIIGILDHEKNIGETVMSYPIIGSDESILDLAHKADCFFITLGHILSSKRRQELFLLLKENSLMLATIISPHAIVANEAVIGEGSIVLHHAIVNSKAVIGKNCIINTKALIEHDSIIEAHCHISTGAIVNGNACVQTGSYVGSGSVVNLGVTVGPNSTIGSSSLVSKSLNESGVYTGVPVRKK